MKNVDTSPEHLRPTAARADDDLGGGPGAASGLGRHPLLVFTVLTFVLSWLPLIPYLLGAFPAPVLACGPFLAAIITAAVVGGRRGLRAYFRRLIRWRVGLGWYVLAFLAPVAGWAMVAYVNVLLGAAPPSPAQLAGWTSILTATLVFLINPFAGAWEEPGWRGYALPLLLRHHPALTGSAILGVTWTLWHLPLFLTGLIPWPDAAVVFALTFVFTAVYLRTAGSVLIAFLLHAAINGAGAFFVGLFTGDDRVRMYWIMAALCAVVAIAAIVAGRDRWRRVPAIGDHDDATASAGSVPRNESLMPSSGLSSSAVNRGGVAGVLASALFVLSTILAQIAPTGLTYESATDYIHEILLVGAFGATMVAILGLHALHRSHPRYGPVGVIGTVLAVTGNGIVTLVLAVSMAVGGRALTEVRIAGAITLLVGSALLGVATLRARLVPWWCGLLLIIALPLGDVANQVFGGAEGLLLGLLWGSVGAALLRRAGSLTQAVGP